MRRIVWTALLVLGIVVLGGTWLITHYERVPVKERLDAEPEARRNPHLALERFMSRMGRPLTRNNDVRLLDSPAPGGVLILDRNRRHHLNPTRVKRLMAWVREGGYLILVPEFTGVSDPICDELDVGEFQFDGKPLADDEDEDEATPVDKPQAAPKRPPRPKTILLNIPGAARPLSANYWTSGREAGEVEPEWTAGTAAYGDQFLHYRVGRGNVTVADSLMQLLNNHAIGDNDHAEILWTLIQTYQPDASKPITLMSRFKVPSLWSWLAESAWTAVVASLALLGLWIWRILPRFGPAAPEPDPSRRELREHLAALGRYVWRASGLEHWLRVAREDFQSRLALRHPAVAALGPEPQAAELARMSQRPASLVAAALFGPAGSPHSFTQALRTLRNLDRVL